MRPLPSEKDRPVYVRLIRPRCPSCNSVKLRAQHTERRSSGLVVRHSKCTVCGRRVYILVE